MLNSSWNGRCSFISQPYFCKQPPLKPLPKTLSSTPVDSYLSFPHLLFNKIFLKIPTNTPFLYNAAFFNLPIFVYNHPSHLHQKCFPYLSHLANSGCLKGQRSYGVSWGLLISPFFLKVWTSSPPSLTTSSYCHYFHALLIPSQELTFLNLFKLIFILSLAFYYSVHGPLYP